MTFQNYDLNLHIVTQVNGNIGKAANILVLEEKDKGIHTGGHNNGTSGYKFGYGTAIGISCSVKKKKGGIK